MKLGSRWYHLIIWQDRSTIYDRAGSRTRYGDAYTTSPSTTATSVVTISRVRRLKRLDHLIHCFFGTMRQHRVFLAEGNFDDFARSGMHDFNAFMMEDFLGAGFFHLLLGPLIAWILGLIGGLVAMRFRRRSPRR